AGAGRAALRGRARAAELPARPLAMARTIVVGYDATDSSERALARAAELAEALKARLLVVSVGGLFPAATAAVGGDPLLAPIPPLAVGPGVMPGGRDAAEKHLEQARATLAGRSIDVECLARVGDAGNELVAVADDAGAELVVVGTREPGFLDRLLGGSVSQEVARRAHCDG